MSLNKPYVSVCIPARFGSTRFPGKPLARLCGKSLIQHTYEVMQGAEMVGRVLVLTDHQEIYRTVKDFGGEVRMVTEPCRTGTDRVAKIGNELQHEVVVNWQADEIPLHRGLVSDLVVPFLGSSAGMGTLKRPLSRSGDAHNPSIVKVTTNQQGQALYFSRSPIPFWRDGYRPSRMPLAYMHLGVYIFRKPVLFQFADAPSGILEEAEKLEQLRALEHGIPIQVWETRHPSLRIDDPTDLPVAEAEFLAYHASEPSEKSDKPAGLK
ncbi:MAG: 3-deoxy-manno-octulosonate cytidylyltransferase [Nitrospirales bacterium]|nr:3-deoxy-manno-octulosonate cytidylyltransferase [Nitrospirales bacterium]